MNLFNNPVISPMLLKEVSKPFNDKNYIYEIKFDGIRALVFASPKEVKIYNRHKRDITYLYPELQSIKNIVTKKVIFDGEITAFKDGFPSFSLLQSRAHLKNPSIIKKESTTNPIIFMAFDILYENKNLINLKLIERKKILEKYSNDDSFMVVKYIEELGIPLYEMIKKNGLEGIVAKRKDSKYYIDSRENVWLKIKNFKEDIYFIGGYLLNKDSDTISLLLGEKKDNSLFFVGKVLMGKKYHLYNTINKMKKRKNSPFVNYDKEGLFVSPTHQCLIAYMEKTSNNHLRQPIFKKEII